MCEKIQPLQKSTNQQLGVETSTGRLKIRFRPDPKRLHSKNDAKLSGQYISPYPEPPRSPSPHVKYRMCLMKLHKKAMKATKKLSLQHRDGRIP